MDTFRFRERNWRDLGYKSKFDGTHQPCPHSGCPWKVHVQSKNKKNMGETKNPTSQQVLGRTNHFVEKYRTEMTTLARSIDLKNGWTNFHLIYIYIYIYIYIKIKGLGNKSGFISCPHGRVCICHALRGRIACSMLQPLANLRAQHHKPTEPYSRLRNKDVR